ncbi:MAG: prolyl oligopeptidase family serine peptidase [Planctomycetales bacterium]|nr:prolyl oligopeptidase family serine peptidase [Planctomycetales bacterium]
MKKPLLLTVIILPACLCGCASMNYPETKRISHTDTYYGITVSDPYQWLEEDCRESKRVSRWIRAQNKLTFDYLYGLEQRGPIKERLTEVWNYEKMGIPRKIGRRYFVSQNDGLQNHNVIYTMHSLNGPRRVLFNPNTWSKDGTTALSSMSFNRDGSLVAYAVQKSGADWNTWKIRDVNTGRDLPEIFDYLKTRHFAWTLHDTGVYYAKFPKPEPGREFIAVNTNMKVMYHRLGTNPSEDTVVYYQPEHPDWNYGVDVTEDGRYLVISVFLGTDDKNRVIYNDLQTPDAPMTDLIAHFDNRYSFIDNTGSVFYFLTDNAAPNGRVIAIDLQKPEPENWKEIIAESDRPLEEVDIINNLLVCSYLKDVTSQIALFTLEGKHVRNVDTPAMGSVSGFSGKMNDTETFYSFESLTTPPSIYRYDMVTGKSEFLERPRINIDFDLYTAEQVFYTSKDGTRVPMFIIYKKGMKRDGSNSALLTGYGGFRISLKPHFGVSRIVWLEMGGVYAIANLRGGGEYGGTWHEAGKKMLKQNVFDDFIAAAEYLIDQKYTSPEKLGISGGSNGGLLVGACMTQRPDLFAAAVPTVGVMDMLRFDQFTAGRYWTDDYGSVRDSKAMFEYLKGYSPYHTIKKGVIYPATLVVTADTDDRVVPGHSFKFIAGLQDAQAGDRPVLIRIQTDAGHGSGKPVSMQIEETADIYAFLAENLNRDN